MSAQFVAAGLALPGNEAAAAAMAQQQAAASAAGGSETAGTGKDVQDKAPAGGAHISVAAQEAAKVPLLPVVPVEGHVPVPSAGALVCVCVCVCVFERYPPKTNREFFERLDRGFVCIWSSQVCTRL